MGRSVGEWVDACMHGQRNAQTQHAIMHACMHAYIIFTYHVPQPLLDIVDRHRLVLDFHSKVGDAPLEVLPLQRTGLQQLIVSLIASVKLRSKGRHLHGGLGVRVLEL